MLITFLPNSSKARKKVKTKDKRIIPKIVIQPCIFRASFEICYGEKKSGVNRNYQEIEEHSYPCLHGSYFIWITAYRLMITDPTEDNNDICRNKYTKSKPRTTRVND